MPLRSPRMVSSKDIEGKILSDISNLFVKCFLRLIIRKQLLFSLIENLTSKWNQRSNKKNLYESWKENVDKEDGIFEDGPELELNYRMRQFVKRYANDQSKNN